MGDGGKGGKGMLARAIYLSGPGDVKRSVGTIYFAYRETLNPRARDEDYFSGEVTRRSEMPRKYRGRKCRPREFRGLLLSFFPSPCGLLSRYFRTGAPEFRHRL